MAGGSPTAKGVAGNKIDVCPPVLPRPGRSRLDARCCEVRASYVTVRPDQIGSQECDVPHAASDIEHTHSAFDSGSLKEARRDRSQDPGLDDQSTRFLGGVPQQI